MNEELLRVLLVDDEASLREPLAKYLRRECGFAVETAATADEALIKVELAQGEYDVALIDDMLMPAADRNPEQLGIKLMTHIRASYPRMEFILFTGWGMSAAKEALRAGAYRYLRKPFDREELAVLIEHASEYRRLKNIVHEKQILERLLETSKALLSEHELQDVLNIICRAAFEVFDVDHSGLVRFDPELKYGYVVAEYPDLGTRGTKIPVHDVVVEERLIASQKPVVIPDTATEPSLGPVFDIFRRFGIRSILLVPVVLKGNVLGSFSLDAIDRLRVFTEEEIALCKIFAAQVAAAIENAQLFTDTKRHAEQLETLRYTTLAITSELKRDTLLQSIIQQAVGLLRAKSGGIYEYEAEQAKLTIIADYGRAESVLGNTLKLGEGLAGRLVRSGASFRIINDYNKWPGRAASYGDKRPFGAVIEVPLKWQKRIIGVLYVDADVGRKFTAEDAALLRLFADHAAIAIVNAEFATELSEQRNHQERLVSASPNGVIAINLHGKVTGFNARAQAILKYHSQEVLGKRVDFLYANRSEPQKVGRRLQKAPDGKLANYETFVRSSEGESIPIRLAATWLYDAQGNCIGSVGYFEDLRSLKEVEQRLAQLLKASTIVAQATHLNDGLQHLAEMLVTVLNATFCRFFLLDESQQFLVVKAEFSILRSKDDLDWRPALEERTMVTEWPALTSILEKGSPKTLKASGKRSASQLTIWSRRLGLKQNLQSLLAIPLNSRNRIVGLLLLGELRQWNRAPFSKDKQELATAIADQTAVFIEHMNLHEITNRHRQLLMTLDAASRHIRAETETAKLLQEIVRLAAEFVGCTAGGLYINRPHLEELELSVTYGLPNDLVGRRQAHAEGSLGHVARSGTSRIIHKYGDQPDCDTILASGGFQTVVGVPLKHAGEVEAVLFVADTKGQHHFTNTDLDILERFAAQAILALQTSRLMSREQRALRHLAVFHRISDFIQATNNLDNILHVVLTGVTAGYGLGFNRAALLLLEIGSAQLVGQMGIGHLSELQAHLDWEGDPLDFEQYLAQLKRGVLSETPISKRIPGLRLAVAATPIDPFSRAILERRAVVIMQDDLDALPGSFVEAFEPALPLIVVPLMTRDEVIGILVADNKFTCSPITQENAETLLTFANTAAIAIDKTRLFWETQKAWERLRSFYEASNALVSSHDPELILQDIVEQARVAANASGVSVLLIDEMGHARDLASAGTNKPGDVTDVMRGDGLSIKVLRTGMPEIVEDTNTRDDINPSSFWRSVAAGLCLPVTLEGQRIGVMWFHYDSQRSFSRTEIEAAKLYVNQAALAYDSSRRIKELEHMRQAADALAGADGLQESLEQIVRGAREVLQADSAVIWSYDTLRNRFIPESWDAPKVASEVWEGFRKEEPRRGGTAYTLMERRWVGVRDVSDTQEYSFLGESSRKLLERIGAHSFQGIALSVGEDRLGLLYVNYNRPRSFSTMERQTAQAFANHAALALKRTKLLNQLNKARNVARRVAGATVLEDLQSTLHSVAEGIQEALDCDALTMHVYDDNKHRFHVKLTSGLRYQEQATGGSGEFRESLVDKMLKQDGIYIVEDVSADPLFKATQFAQREQIASCAAIPLKIGSEAVGVIFVNYRTPHLLTSDEQMNLELFANQATVAIRNDQLYERMQRRARALKALYEAGRAVTRSLELDTILAAIAEQAYTLTGAYGKMARYCHLALVKDNLLEFIAAYPAEYLAKIQHKLGIIDLEGSKTIGIIGRTVKSGQSQLISNVAQEPDYLEYDDETRSELAVPIKIGDDVIGVINVEHPDNNAFDLGDQTALEALAAQAAIALQNAHLYVQVHQRAQQLQILYETGLKLTSELSVGTVLQEVVHHARRLTDAQYGALGVLDAEGKIDPFIISGLDHEVRRHIGSPPLGRRVLGLLLSGRMPIREADIRSRSDFHGYPAHHPTMTSFLGVPILYQGKVIGSLYTANKLGAPEFSQEDQNVLELLAAQAAVAIENAGLFEQTKRAYEATDRRLQEQLLLHNVALAASSTIKLDEVLQAVAHSIESTLGYESVGIHLVDETTQELTGPMYYAGLWPRELNFSKEQGITGRVVRTAASALVPDTSRDPDYLPGTLDTRSEICVPLLVNNKVVGIINVESTRINALTKHDLQLIETIAGQVVHWIENARLYTQLEQTKEMLVARSAVAWMGMVSATWRHAIEGHAMTIAEELDALRENLRDIVRTDSIEKKLAKIERVAKLILDKPITPPLSGEEKVDSVPVNDLIRERLKQLEKNEPYKLVDCRFHSYMEDSVTVRISPEWLRRIFDILIDNAVEAVRQSPIKDIRVTTRRSTEWITIAISDTGDGIPDDIRSQLFRQPIKKFRGDKGMGVGLLLAQTIAHTYNGKIDEEHLESSGTTMVIRLPPEL
jgi:PAS domain S-box-containing protein